MRLRAYLRFALTELLWSAEASLCIWLATMAESYVGGRIFAVLVLWSVLSIQTFLNLNADLMNAEEKKIVQDYAKNLEGA